MTRKINELRRLEKEFRDQAKMSAESGLEILGYNFVTVTYVQTADNLLHPGECTLYVTFDYWEPGDAETECGWVTNAFEEICLEEAEDDEYYITDSTFQYFLDAYKDTKTAEAFSKEAFELFVEEVK